MIKSSNGMEQMLALTDEERRRDDEASLAWLMEVFYSYLIHTPTTGLRPGPRHPWFHLTLEF
jgi:hypothetical protein